MPQITVTDEQGNSYFPTYPRLGKRTCQKRAGKIHQCKYDLSELSAAESGGTADDRKYKYKQPHSSHCR